MPSTIARNCPGLRYLRQSLPLLYRKTAASFVPWYNTYGNHRSLGRFEDANELREPHPGLSFSPCFETRISLHSTSRGNRADPSLSKEMHESFESGPFWDKYAPRRLKDSGLSRRRLGQPPSRESIPSHYGWLPYWLHSPSAFLMSGCVSAVSGHYTIKSQIDVRKLCAKTKDVRYNWVYHDLDFQANCLYLLGRIEAEMPYRRGLGAYMLNISAGLGQLDAALLLHQLEKTDPATFAMYLEQRAIIAKAAQQRLDWRAMVAHSEYLLSKAKRRSGRGSLEGVELQECLDLLTEAIPMTNHEETTSTKREPPPQDYLDADAIDKFDPPHKLLLEITSSALSNGNQIDKVNDAFDLAAMTGVNEYKDHQAASQYLRHRKPVESYTPEWIQCAAFAASDADRIACLEYAKYCLERDGWYPTIAKRILDKVDFQYRQDRQRAREEGGFDVQKPTDEETTALIMREKDDSLLEKQEGLGWMKHAAQLYLDNAGIMANRYYIIAGMLRQNGFMTEGLQVLEEAKQAIVQESVDRPSEILRVKLIVQEYIDYWDKRPIQDVLTPGQIERLLGPPKVIANMREQKTENQVS